MRIRNVLLVEDNPGDADLIRQTLETGKATLSISVARDGEEAIDYLLRRASHKTATRPDLVILDLNLPKKDGREVLAEVRRHHGLLTVPIVVFTSSDAKRDVVTSYELGANCYVTKPGGLDAFQSAVRAIGEFWLSVVTRA